MIERALIAVGLHWRSCVLATDSLCIANELDAHSDPDGIGLAPNKDEAPEPGVYLFEGTHKVCVSNTWTGYDEWLEFVGTYRKPSPEEIGALLTMQPPEETYDSGDTP